LRCGRFDLAAEPLGVRSVLSCPVSRLRRSRSPEDGSGNGLAEGRATAAEVRPDTGPFYLTRDAVCPIVAEIWVSRMTTDIGIPSLNLGTFRGDLELTGI